MEWSYIVKGIENIKHKKIPLGQTKEDFEIIYLDFTMLETRCFQHISKTLCLFSLSLYKQNPLQLLS